MANLSIRGLRTRRPNYDAGAHRITGTANNTGTPETPVHRRVRLHVSATGRPVADTWSDAATGIYSFQNLALDTYYVIGFDHTGQYAGVAETDLTPDPMP